jgi:hypothetical protein
MHNIDIDVSSKALTALLPYCIIDVRGGGRSGDGAVVQVHCCFGGGRAVVVENDGRSADNFVWFCIFNDTPLTHLTTILHNDTKT